MTNQRGRVLIFKLNLLPLLLLFVTTKISIAWFFIPSYHFVIYVFYQNFKN